jgi:hypothetical protein
MTLSRAASISYTPPYLKSSPAGQLLIWAVTGRNGSPSNNGKEPSSYYGRIDLSDGATIVPSTATKSALVAEDPVEVQSGAEEEEEAASRCERHNEAHDWSLARRIVVAGIICLYT